MSLEEKEPAGAFNKAQRLIEYRQGIRLEGKYKGHKAERLQGISALAATAR
jgi:hypothetical protein